MKKFIIFAIATLGVSMVAHAGFVVEPGVGAQGVTGTAPFSYKFNTTNFQYTQTSYPVSLMLYWHATNGFMFGVNAEYFMSGTLTGTSGLTINDTFTRTVAAVILGYESPKGFRIWAGYDAMNNITNTPGTGANANDFTALNNTGAQVGIGWKFKDHFAVNAVYDAASTSPTSITPKAGGTGTFTSSTYNAITDGTIAINVSFPFGGSK